MKKILLLILIVTPFISGCDILSSKGPKKELNLMTDGSGSDFDVSIGIGDQLQPGEVSITLNDCSDDLKIPKNNQDFKDFSDESIPEEEKEGMATDTTFVVEVNRGDQRLLVKDDGTFVNGDDFDWDDAGDGRYQTSLNIGETAKISEPLLDGDVLTIRRGHAVIGGPGPKPEFGMVDVTVNSDGSGEFDDSYKLEEKLPTSKIIEIKPGDDPNNYLSNQAQVVVGEDVSDGKLSITCLETDKDYCEISSGYKFKTQFGRIPIKEQGRLKVGETYTFDLPLTKGTVITIEGDDWEFYNGWYYRGETTLPETPPQYPTQKLEITVK